MRGKNREIHEQETATLLTHVRELQLRLLVTAVVLIGAAVIAYFYYGQILDILRRPLNAPLYINSVSGSFAFVMKICMVAGIAVSVPLIVYNFIMFVRPAFLEIFSRKRVFLMTFGSVVAAATGVLFGYFFIIPGAIHFFAGFQVNGLHEMIGADGYLNFVVNVLVTFVLMFQLPILASLIDRIKPISPRAMLKGEKWAAVVSVIVSILVPFAMDFMTQALIAAPIFILYNVSFAVIAFQHWYARRGEKKAAKAERRMAKPARMVAVKPQVTPRHVPSLQPVAASLQPHPQLAEIMATQASQPTRPAVRPTLQPSVVKPALQAVKPLAPRMSMDGMTRVRTQPTSVIRKNTIQDIQSPNGRPLQTMKMMSDIR